MAASAQPTWLDKFFYKSVQWLGVGLPDEPVLNFLSGFTVVDNPTNGSTDVSVEASSTTVFDGPITAPVTPSSLVTGTCYLVDTSGGGFTQDLPTTGLVDGEYYEWFDAKSQWSSNPTATKNLTLDGVSNEILDPNYVGITGIYATDVVLQTVGAKFRTTWSAALGKWLTW